MPNNLTCPICGGPMVSRLTKQGQGLWAAPQRFWGCAKFPNCRGTRDTDGLSRAERAREADEDFTGNPQDY
jgi:ssDNA-binding Zn-finger/Zn-ribbon topoisomerase 1